MEILIVLVILGVVAGLAFPVLTAQIEKSRAQEAITSLGTVKEAMVRYYQAQTLAPTYVGATFANINYNPNTAAGGQTPLFTYALSNLAAATFTCTATRIGGAAADTVVIDQTGTITRNGAYA